MMLQFPNLRPGQLWCGQGCLLKEGGTLNTRLSILSAAPEVLTVTQVPVPGHLPLALSPGP